ncbi:DUF169 domain-containing protein [Lagierella sp.]|uniref:DUF169 domain-containing protein n=1 Tax=Lagierella sp. TaxID=2849657 RepID=UPI002630F950|nr:DUF169 domain-containing protein [Lagierella sp.]
MDKENKTTKQNYYIKVLKSILDIEREIVGVKVHVTKDDFVKSKFREVNRKIAYCTLVRNATRGDSIKIAGDKFACVGAAASLGITKARTNSETGFRQYENSTYGTMPISISYAKRHAHIKMQTYGVSIGPLEDFDFEPDVVIIVCNPNNAMRIIQGYNHNHSFYDGFEFIGLGAICREVTSFPYENNKINISMMCPGTRMLCQWDINEMAVGIPFSQFYSTVEGIVNTINPFERKKRKRKIIQNLKDKDLDIGIDIKLDQNYDDAAYVGMTEKEIQEFNENHR